MSAAEFAQFFHEADKDNSGSLTTNEVIKTLRKAGFQGTDETIKAKLLTLDHNKDGKVYFEDFLKALGKQPENVLREARLRYMFRTYDKNNSGMLEKSDIDASFKEVGKKMTEAELAKVMSLMDANKDGKIDYEEFLKYYSTP